MARTFQGYNKQVQGIYEQSASSDAVVGDVVAVSGYARAWIYCSAGLVTGGDSDDIIIYTVAKNTGTTTASTDFVVITAATTTLGPSADTDTALGIEFIEIDLLKHGMAGGALQVTATGSLGITAACSAGVILNRPIGIHSSTSMTIVNPASS